MPQGVYSGRRPPAPASATCRRASMQMCCFHGCCFWSPRPVRSALLGPCPPRRPCWRCRAPTIFGYTSCGHPCWRRIPPGGGTAARASAHRRPAAALLGSRPEAVARVSSDVAVGTTPPVASHRVEHLSPLWSGSRVECGSAGAGMLDAPAFSGGCARA
jgi:hypothetical protein